MRVEKSEVDCEIWVHRFLHKRSLRSGFFAFHSIGGGLWRRDLVSSSWSHQWFLFGLSISLHWDLCLGTWCGQKSFLVGHFWRHGCHQWKSILLWLLEVGISRLWPFHSHWFFGLLPLLLFLYSDLFLFFSFPVQFLLLLLLLFQKFHLLARPIIHPNLELAFKDISRLRSEFLRSCRFRGRWIHLVNHPINRKIWLLDIISGAGTHSEIIRFNKSWSRSCV